MGIKKKNIYRLQSGNVKKNINLKNYLKIIQDNNIKNLSSIPTELFIKEKKKFSTSSISNIDPQFIIITNDLIMEERNRNYIIVQKKIKKSKKLFKSSLKAQFKNFLDYQKNNECITERDSAVFAFYQLTSIMIQIKKPKNSELEGYGLYEPIKLADIRLFILEELIKEYCKSICLEFKDDDWLYLNPEFKFQLLLQKTNNDSNCNTNTKLIKFLHKKIYPLILLYIEFLKKEKKK